MPNLFWTVRRADTDFVTCPTFHFIGQTDDILVRVSLWLVNRPSLAGYWKFNTSLLEIRNFPDRLEYLFQRVFVGAVTGNWWWGSFKHRISDFAVENGHQLNLDKTLEDKLFRAMKGGFPHLARWDLEREASKRCNGYVVRLRLKRVPNEAVKYNAFALEEEVRRFPFRYIDSVKSPDGHVLLSNCEMLEAFRVHFRDRFFSLFWPPSSGVSQLFSWLSSPSGGGSSLLRGFSYWMRDSWCFEARTRLFTRRRVLEAAAHVCAYSDGHVPPLAPIAEERWQACLGGFRWLQAHNSAKHSVKDFAPGLSEPFTASLAIWSDLSRGTL